MERRPFGPTGRDVAVIGQGTWKLQDHAAARAALSRGLELGMDHIDTAELYTGSEAVIAALLKDRDEVFLVSKVLPHHASAAGTRKALDESLQRLRTDHLDVYLLHWAGQVPIAETMATMAELIDEGRIRAAGVSNLDVSEMEEAREGLGGHPLACNQVLYHPAQRDIEVEILPYCKQHGIAVVGYSPFGSGAFPRGRRDAQALSDIGREHGKTPHQVILDVLSRDPSVFLIPKAETIEHVEQNAAALDERLPDDAVAAFDQAFPVPERAQGVPSL